MSELIVEVHIVVTESDASRTVIEEIVQQKIWATGFKRGIPGFVNAYVSDVRGEDDGPVGESE